MRGRQYPYDVTGRHLEHSEPFGSMNIQHCDVCDILGFNSDSLSESDRSNNAGYFVAHIGARSVIYHFVMHIAKFGNIWQVGFHGNKLILRRTASYSSRFELRFRK